MAMTHDTREATPPDAMKLTDIQARRLSALSGVDAKEIVGRPIGELLDTLKWRIDPELLFFRRVCGKVVKKDPVTGVEHGVPFATVYVEDTDCRFLSYYPVGWRWGWHFPLFCHREVIATTHTDACGNWCVWIPRFDIDWILRWRRHRICFWDIFRRPSIGDLLDIPELTPVGPVPPGPGPDPSPIERLARMPAPSMEALVGPAGRAIARSVGLAQAMRTFGARTEDHADLMQARAFEEELPPPLPQEVQQALAGGAVEGKGADRQEAVARTIAELAGVDVSALKGLDLGRVIGPFRRCIDIFLPEWDVVFDVPDITFRVTQDVDGDGDEETIYSEGFFDVRWNAGPIGPVKLVASQIARETRVCDTPSVPCKEVPEILFAGLMPLTDPAYFDAVEGYAKRPNRPKPGGPRPAAKTPFLQTLQIYGCVNVPGAHYYRVLASTDNGATFNAVTGLSWNIFPLPFGPPHPVVPDASGWYPVLPNPTDFHPADMILDWPTPALGKVVLKVQVADAAKTPLAVASNVVAIQVDNTAPTATFTTLAWKFASEPDSAFTGPGRNLLVPCPTIRRGSPKRDIVVKFEVAVSAHHLRDASLFSFGCGEGAFALDAGQPHLTAHWHANVLDNAVTLFGRYNLDAASSHEGSYGFGCTANSRAMNPSGADGGNLLPADWNYDVVYAYAQPEVSVAIIDAN